MNDTAALPADEHVNRGLALAERGAFNEAFPEFGTAIKLDPNNFRAYQASAELYEHVGDFETALRGYTHAVRCDPASMHAFERRANSTVKWAV
jgi:Tfp pilus assembly protein PilF